MISRISHLCIIPHQGLFLCLSFHPTLKASFWWSCSYGGYKGKLASHILPSQKPDPKEKQVINLNQDVQVCGYFWWINSFVRIIFLLFLFLFGQGLSFSLLFFFDMPCGHVAYLLWVCIFSLLFFLYALGACGIPPLGMHLFISFCIAHTKNIQGREKSHKGVPPSSTKNIHTFTYLDQGL